MQINNLLDKLHLSNHSEDLPPGASAVKSILNRGTGWYCTDCLMFIVPMYIRQGKLIYPVCRVCFEDAIDANQCRCESGLQGLAVIDGQGKRLGLTGISETTGKVCD